MNRQQLKELIKECIKEITQKDINAVHPKIMDIDDDLNKLTLSNLKSLRDKAKSFYYAERKKSEPNTELIDTLIKRVGKYNDEINKRLKYINKPV